MSMSLLARSRRAVLTALSLSIALFFSGANRALADGVAYVLWSPPSGQNAQVKVINTTTSTVTASVTLPLTSRVFISSVLNLGNRVFVSSRDTIYEIDTATNTLIRQINTGRPNLDKMLLDPANPNRLLVLDRTNSIWQVNLSTGAVSSLLSAVANTFTIRPGTREIYLSPSVTPARIDVHNLDTGALIRSTNSNILVTGVEDIDFLDANTLMMHGYGVGRYDLSSGALVPVYQFNDGDAGWGYDWMITSDGSRLMQPGWTQSRVRNASNGAVTAANFPATNFYYGSAAPGDDGTFIMSGGDLTGSNSMGVGKLRIGRQSDLTFTSELDFGLGTVIARGSPYRTVSASTLPTQTLTILGGTGATGSLAPNVEYFNPATGLWQPAYLVGPHPWGQITGTTSWINYKTDNASDPGAGANGTNSTFWYLYRVRFTVPSDAVNPRMTFSAKADNFAQVAINGVTTGGSTQFINNTNVNNVIVGSSSPATQVNADAVFTQAVHPGENTITLNIGDWGGLNGFNFRIDLSMQSSQALEIVTPPTDTTPPVISAPANIVTEATSAAGKVVTFAATATDNVDGPVQVIASPASGSTFPITTTAVGLAASDAAHNTATASFLVTVQDTTPPAIGAAPVLTPIEATGPNGAVVTFTVPTATDIVDGTVAVSATPASGSTFGLGNSVVTLRSTDAHNNSASKTFAVVVQDTTPPALTLPTSQTLEATSAAGAVATFAASATDIVTANPTITYSAASGSTFGFGSTTVNVSAKDAANNTSSGSFTITVRDTTAPVLATVSANQTAEASSSAGATVTYAAATATDAVGPVTLSYSHASGAVFPIGTTVVTVSAVDAAGNAALAKTFTVTVRDTTAPALTVPTVTAVEATGPTGAIVNYPAATATDAVGVTSLTYSRASGTTFAIGTTSVTVTATDAAGNLTTKSFNVTVKDSTAPAIVATLSPRGGGDDESSQFFTIAYSATDAVGVKTLTATLNGVTVTNGQVVQLQTIKSGAQSVKRDDGKLQIKATAFALVVTAVDTAGNTITKTVVPVFVKNGKDDEDKKSDEKKNDDKKEDSKESSGKDK